MTDTTREALLAEVLRWTSPADRVRENEITVGDYMTETGLCHSAAKRALDRLVDEGRLVRREARVTTGQRVTAYGAVNKE